MLANCLKIDNKFMKSKSEIGEQGKIEIKKISTEQLL